MNTYIDHSSIQTSYLYNNKQSGSGKGYCIIKVQIIQKYIYKERIYKKSKSLNFNTDQQEYSINHSVAYVLCVPMQAFNKSLQINITNQTSYQTSGKRQPSTWKMRRITLTSQKVNLCVNSWLQITSTPPQKLSKFML